MSKALEDMAERLCEAFENDGEVSSASWPYTQRHERAKWIRLAGMYPLPTNATATPATPAQSHTTTEIVPQLKARLVEIVAEFNSQCWFCAANEIQRMADNYPVVEHEADPKAWVMAEKAWSQRGTAAINPYNRTYQPMSARVWRACIDEIRRQQGTAPA